MANCSLYAHDITIKNNNGVVFYYNYSADGLTLEVTHGDRPYKGIITIPEEVTYMNRTRKVTKIGKEAFRYCKELVSVKLPNTITSIEECAFDDCTGLTTISIPNSVTKIGYAAFQGCIKLKSIIIPESVREIGIHSFQYCI